MVDKPKRKKGRPNAYNEIIEPRIDEICEWARAGATNVEIASALGIGRSTFLAHVRENPSFSDSLKEARMSGVPMVKLSLFKKCIGFEYEETKTSIRIDEDGEKKQFIEKTKKYYPPATDAIQLFLLNNADDFHIKDPWSRKMKEMEIELKKEMMENQLF